MKLIIKDVIQDVIDGAKSYEFWMTFGMNDIKAKYRRSKLGQWWITLSVALFILVIGALYQGIFNADSKTYLVYVAIGYIIWLFMQDSIGSGCLVIAQAKPFLLQKKWPISTFIYRLVYREILIFFHHVVLVPPLFLWLGLWPGLIGIFYSILGMLLVIFTSFWIIFLLAIISLRFRDFSPIIQSLLRMAFFATPIIWQERNLGQLGEYINLLNPFGYFLKIVREPLLGNSFPQQAWLVSSCISVGLLVLTLCVFASTNKRIQYWL